MARRPWKLVAAFISIAVGQYALYLGLWGNAAAIGEAAPGSIPQWLSIAVAVLGFPLMLLPERWFTALRPLLGDDNNSLFVVAAVNALLWAGTVVWLLRLLAARARQTLVLTDRRSHRSIVQAFRRLHF